MKSKFLFASFFLTSFVFGQNATIISMETLIRNFLNKKVDSIHENITGLTETDNLKPLAFILDGKIHLAKSVVLFNSHKIEEIYFRKDSMNIISTLYLILTPKSADMVDILIRSFGNWYSRMSASTETDLGIELGVNYGWKLEEYGILLLDGYFEDKNLIIIDNKTNRFVRPIEEVK